MTEKEFYVHVDFNEQIDSSIFNKKDLYFKIIDLHKKEPLIQVDNYVFKGM